MIIHLSEKDKATPMKSPKTVAEILQPLLSQETPADQDKEHFWVFYLNACHEIQDLELVSLGVLTCAIVHPREVFTNAVAIRCASIIVAHNHPSGDLSPSDADIEVTKRLVSAGEILGIEVVDHVIITRNGFTSLKERVYM